MIDRDTAIRWAKEAGAGFLVVDGNGGLGGPIFDSVEQLQTLITRAMNEAFEKAPQHAWEHYMKACADQRSNPHVNDLDPWASFNSIRSLKEST